MASTSILYPKTNLKQRNHFPTDQHRPRKLKDFLNDNPDSCSSTGRFKSFPRDLNSKAASTRFSAFQAVINAVKKLPFTSTIKSQSIFPRSLSRRLSKKNRRPSKPCEIKITVRVKDIVRWASFRDLLEEKSRSLDFASSPHHCTTTTGSTPTTCSSNGSSWCESDFTSEYLPSWSSNSQESGETEVHVGKTHLPRVGRDYVEATTGAKVYAAVGPEGETTACNEKEQQSPISVLDFHVGENEEPFSSFTRSLATIQRTRQNLMQKIQRFENLAKVLEPFDLEEWMSMEENTRFEEEYEEEEEEEEEEEDEIEKKVRELLNHIKATSSVDIGKAKAEKLLFDFFSDELSSKRCHDDDDDEFNCEMVSMAKAWMKGEHNGLHEWGVEHKREAYVSEMDRRERWSSFEEEQQEIALEIETRVLGCLVDEVLADFF